MSTSSPFSSSAPSGALSAETRIAIIAARWNEEIVESLIEGAQSALLELGMNADQIALYRCPGSYEIPILAKACADTKRFHAIIALGCVIRGETYHFEIVADGVSQGLMRVMLDSSVPCLNGVLTTENQEQAEARAGKGANNKGWECAYAASELLSVLNSIS